MGQVKLRKKICGEEDCRTMPARKYSSSLCVDILGQDFKAKMKSWLKYDLDLQEASQRYADIIDIFLHGAVAHVTSYSLIMLSSLIVMSLCR
ncbi:MAG: hypothetical protein AABY81_01015 [Pseudomonadota bacterium]